MNRWLGRVGVALMVALVGAAGPVAADQTAGAGTGGTDPILTRLIEGNARFVANGGLACSRNDAVLRATLATGQKPSAIVLSCSDSRVPPEAVFDQALGDLFVVRVAGNVPDPLVLGSIEYAAEHLGASLVVVLGHERCGAVTAAVESNQEAEGNLGAILHAIAPAVETARCVARSAPRAALVDAAIDANVHQVMKELTRGSPLLAHLVAEQRLRIIGAKYDLDDGIVRVLGPAAECRK